jgi:hypothetical protein
MGGLKYDEVEDQKLAIRRQWCHFIMLGDPYWDLLDAT